MKIIQTLDEISKKNLSIVSVVKIISSYKFLSNESKIIVAKNEDKLKKAVDLSVEKYCGVMEMFRKFAELDIKTIFHHK